MNSEPENTEDAVLAHIWQLATAVREASYQAAVAAYENARIDGLCHEGAWECAVDAMRAVDFEAVLAAAIK